MTIARLIEGRDQIIICCKPDDSVREAATMLSDRRIGCLPVMDDEQVVGIFSERDLLYCVAKRGGEALDLPVGEVMTAPAITITDSENALDTLSLMTKRRIRHLPVIRDGKMVAFISIGDIVKYRIEMVEAEAKEMRDYIRTV